MVPVWSPFSCVRAFPLVDVRGQQGASASPPVHRRQVRELLEGHREFMFSVEVCVRLEFPVSDLRHVYRPYNDRGLLLLDPPKEDPSHCCQ